MAQIREMISPKVSVVIPVYNTEDYVEEAVRSIMNQTLRNIEIIIIDDGSTDNSLAVIKKLAGEDNRISCFSQTNQGQSVARNSGIEKASGEFIYFMDSDDFLEKEAFEVCYNKCTSENLDFVFFDAESFIDNNDHLVGFDYRRTYLLREEMVYAGKDILDHMLNKKIYRASVCLNLIKRSFIKQNQLNFYPGIIHEDELFTSQLYLLSNRVSCIQQVFYHRRVRANSTMSKMFNDRNIEGYLTVIRELKSIYIKDTKHKILIDRLIGYILNPTIYNSKDLSATKRIQLLLHCIRNDYIFLIKMKNIIILLFPFLITVKAILKKYILCRL